MQRKIRSARCKQGTTARTRLWHVSRAQTQATTCSVNSPNDLLYLTLAVPRTSFSFLACPSYSDTQVPSLASSANPMSHLSHATRAPSVALIATAGIALMRKDKLYRMSLQCMMRA